jgi:hypothetical protein
MAFGTLFILFLSAVIVLWLGIIDFEETRSLWNWEGLVISLFLVMVESSLDEAMLDLEFLF